jgi:hypothetical protein
MRRTFLLALAALLPVAATAQQGGNVRPYAVDEFRLGTPLSEFREVERLAETPVEGARQALVCSGEDSAGADRVQPNPHLREAGAIKCTPLLWRPGDETPVIGTLELFGEHVECEFLFYRGRNDTEPRLTQITLGFNNQRFQNILAIFRRAYGQPTGFEVDGVTTIFGSDLPNATYVWENRVSTIRLDTYSVTLDRMSVIFVQNELWDELGRRLRRISAPR